MDKNDWKVGDAKQRFSEVLRRSEKEPQLIYRRDKLVAAVISVNHERDVPGRERRTIADRFAEARERFAEDLDSFSPPKRRSRKNPFTDVLDDLAG